MTVKMGQEKATIIKIISVIIISSIMVIKLTYFNEKP